MRRQRQIRAATVSQGESPGHVILYQAYNAAIARAAVHANSFLAPLQQGLWRADRMTWVKPSAVWMGYRCGWGLFKDANQSHVLALHIPEDKFFALLSLARPATALALRTTFLNRLGAAAQGVAAPLAQTPGKLPFSLPPPWRTSSNPSPP